MLTDPEYWVEMLFKALQGLQHDGIRLLLSDRIPSGIHLAKQIKLALKLLNERSPHEPYEKFRFDLEELGFEAGWGNTAARVSETLELLDRLIYSPEPGILEAFVPVSPLFFVSSSFLSTVGLDRKMF